MTNAVAVPEVETVKLSEIEVEKGFNPRGNITKDSVSDLAKSIKQEGILQPVLVRKDTDGYKLVAGHRRIAAAKIAGIEDVPVLVRSDVDDEQAKALAFDENEQREDMTPMARAIALNHQFKKLGSFKKVAETRSLNAQQVGSLVKMCDLPESVQKVALNHRDFGPDLAKTLVEVAEVPGGEPVAKFLADQAMTDPKIYRKVRDEVTSALDEIERFRDRAESVKERDSVPFVQTIRGVEPQHVFNDERIATLTEKAMAAATAWGNDEYSLQRMTGLRRVRNDSWSTGEPGVEVSLTEESADRIKAAQSAFILEDEYQVRIYIFDKEVFESEVEQIIETAEAIVKAELKEREQAAKEKAEQAGIEVKEGEDPVKEQRRLEREQQKEAATKARANNEAIGDALLKRGTKPMAKKDQLETIRLMAKVTVRQADNLAAIGMRLCFTSWKESEFKELKSGAKREKVTYLEQREAQDRLIESIDNAKSVDEILRIITDALVSATYSDEQELPQSKRCYKATFNPVIRVERDDMELIDRLAKGMLPEDVEKLREKSVKAGYEGMHSYRS